MGTGVRLLPLTGGLVVGIAAGDRLTKLGGAKVAVAVGFALASAESDGWRDMMSAPQHADGRSS
jgi:hypothetical protein